MPRSTLTDDDLAIITKLVRETVDYDPFPFSPRIKSLKAILAKLNPPAPRPEPLPAPKPSGERSKFSVNATGVATDATSVESRDNPSRTTVVAISQAFGSIALRLAKLDTFARLHPSSSATRSRSRDEHLIEGVALGVLATREKPTQLVLLLRE
jgi:hypothetical protein